MSDAPPPIEPLDVPEARSVTVEIPTARPLGPSPATYREKIAIFLSDSTRGAVLVDMLAVFGCLMAFEMLVGVIMVLLTGIEEFTEAGEPDPEAIRQFLLPLLALRAAAAIGLVWLVLRCRRQSLASIGLVRRSWGLDLGIGACSTCVAYVLIVCGYVVLWFVAPELIEQTDNASRLIELLPRLSTAGFVIMSALVGVYEEVLFRGFLMTRLRRATSSWTAAVFLSSLIFTALHATDQEPIALVAVAILSVVFSLVTIWRRSLIPAIVGHTLFDLSQLIGLMWQAGDAWT